MGFDWIFINLCPYHLSHPKDLGTEERGESGKLKKKEEIEQIGE